MPPSLERGISGPSFGPLRPLVRTSQLLTAPEAGGPAGTLARRGRPGEDTLIDDAANRRRALRLLAMATLPVLVVVAVLGALLTNPVAGLVIGVVIAGAAGAWLWRRGPSLAAHALPARPADPVGAARLHNVVNGLCTAAGLPKPELLIADDPAPNALAYGCDTRSATLVVTSGLLERLNRIELEGVVARELAGIKNGDIRPATLAVALLAVVGPVRPLADRVRAAAVPVSPVAADANGVAITRYPPGLAAAYEKVRTDGPSVRTGAATIAHLWLVPPAGATNATRPPLEERIEALREL